MSIHPVVSALEPYSKPLCLYLKTFETFPDFLLVGKGLFVDLVADIFDEAHDSFSLFDIFSKFSESSESNHHLLQLKRRWVLMSAKKLKIEFSKLLKSTQQ